jgi:hypothetical protein
MPSDSARGEKAALTATHAQSVVAALQRIVEGLGDGKKLRLAMDQAPVGPHPERLQHRDIPRQQLRHAAACRCGIHMTNFHAS